MKLLKASVALSLVFLLVGCASSYVLVGAKRPAIDPSQVQVLITPPAHYQTIAVLQSSDLGAFCFTMQCRTNKVMDRLKADAAKLGANAILLQGLDTQYAGSVGMGTANTTYGNHSAYTSGIGYSVAETSKVGKALAIYIQSN